MRFVIFLFFLSKGLATDVDERLEAIKLDLWSRGAFALDQTALFGEDLVDQLNGFQSKAAWARLEPVKRARRTKPEECFGHQCLSALRGGATSHQEDKIEELGRKFGSGFLEAIEQNKKDHAADCEASCEVYYCAKEDTAIPSLSHVLKEQTEIQSYSMGAVPPEDFAQDFGFPLDLIKVTNGPSLFSKEEASKVITDAEEEGVANNEYKSGKYKLGGDWLTNLPKTREWFNSRLKDTFFPLLSHLFPEVVSSPAVLRAHSVSLLKYNSSHPRTDVHIDNGILAMTLAMTPQDEYEGGGTFFEHFDTVLPMDVGHGTFRPGSVRHGGHRVIHGTRYILGAFLLIEDRVEHVRRLKNRGSELRRVGDLDAAVKHFEWALGLNPKCTTCLKDWAEILQFQKDFTKAEQILREALDLLEEKDSDAFFNLGLTLSAMGRDDESIDAYGKSMKLNAEDAELLYNLGMKLGARGDRDEENRMYARAVQVDPKFGGAWLNWGTNLAEKGNFDDAELMFVKSLDCAPDVVPKAMINLALIRHSQTGFKIEQRDIEGAMETALQSSQYLDAAKPLLDELVEKGDDEAVRFLNQFKPLRLQCHRNMGQLYAGTGDLTSAEEEFRTATASFPEEPMALQMLGRILELQGKTEEAEQIKTKYLQMMR